MALDDFSSDDSSSSSTSTTQSTSKEPLGSDNSPGEARQVFSQDPNVSPRAILYQINSHTPMRVKQFSTDRILKGEVVCYASDPAIENQDLTVAVFTSILSAIDRPEYDKQTDIEVCIWNIKLQERSGTSRLISPHKDWEVELHSEIGLQLNEIME